MSNKRMLPDFKMLASLGKIIGVSSIFKFGRNRDIDTKTTPEDVTSSGGLKLFPNGTSTLRVVSTSKYDKDGGKGLNSVKIYGLDSDYNIISESITMNGTNTVISANSYLRVYRMYGTLAGSLQRAAGTISATHMEGIISTVEAESGQSQDATFTVPSGHLLVVDKIRASIERGNSGAGAQVSFEIKTFGTNVWREQADISLSSTGSSHVEVDSGGVWLSIPEKTDVRIHVSFVQTNNSRITAAFDGLLIDLALIAW